MGWCRILFTQSGGNKKQEETKLAEENTLKEGKKKKLESNFWAD